MKTYNDKFQALKLALEYYILNTSAKLSDSELKRLAEILEIAESDSFLDNLITDIDISVAENSMSPKEIEEYCKKSREETSTYLSASLKIQSLNLINFSN